MDVDAPELEATLVLAIKPSPNRYRDTLKTEPITRIILKQPKNIEYRRRLKTDTDPTLVYVANKHKIVAFKV